MIAVRRSTTNTYTYDTDPYKWESDQSLINFTFIDFAKSDYWYTDTGISTGYNAGYNEAGVWIYPKPETGTEMLVSFYSGYSYTKCLLYCEKSGILSESF